MKKVTITSIPVKYNGYYQWLLLGLYELSKSKSIDLHFKLPLYQGVYYYLLNNSLRKLCSRLALRFRLLRFENYLMELIVNNDKIIRKVVFDTADSPFEFNAKYLQDCDYYFKMQCPKDIDSKGFRLTDQVYIPYIPEVLKYKQKIKPSMHALRWLAWSISHNSLQKAYNHYMSNAVSARNKILMCYFGGAKGPAPKVITTSELNFDDESVIMGYFSGKVHHPNEKRYRLYKIMKNLGEKYDARVIDKSGVIDDQLYLQKDEVIPLNQFTKHISKFQYNLNISGYRLSIPSRFIESFMVGTAIVTDKLSVKWYKDFDNEVIELPEMGYLPENQVSWDEISQSIVSLQHVDSAEVMKSYNEKWSPTAFAKYFINTIS